MSEGLIFRHFENKEGLLNAIMEEGEKRAESLFADIVLEKDPKTVLRKTLDIGPRMSADPEAKDFWKLQYKLKWELEQYGEHKTEPLRLALANAFKALGYPNADMEAMQLMLIMDGWAMRYYLSAAFDVHAVAQALKEKYGL